MHALDPASLRLRPAVPLRARHPQGGSPFHGLRRLRHPAQHV